MCLLRSCAAVQFLVDTGEAPLGAKQQAAKKATAGKLRDGSVVDYAVKNMSAGSTADFLVRRGDIEAVASVGDGGDSGGDGDGGDSGPAAPREVAELLEEAVELKQKMPVSSSSSSGTGGGAGSSSSSSSSSGGGEEERERRGDYCLLRVQLEAVDKDCGRTPVAEMGHADKIVRAGELRLDGNEWFKRGLHARASRRYSAALNLISLDQGYSVAERRAVRSEGNLCFLNRAQCYLKLGEWRRARKDADLALAIDVSDGDSE